MRMAAIDLVCLGDSIVYGYGTYPMGAWPRLAGEALGIRILNQGENGDTADGMNVRFMEDVLYHRPKEVFIMGGANDILMGIPQSHTCESMDRMVRKAEKAGIPVILGIPLQIDGELLEKCWFSCHSIEHTMALFREYREWLLDYCGKRQIPTVDFQEKFPEYLKKEGIVRGLQDGVHPTAEGYRVMAEIFSDAYRQIHGEK